MTGNPDHKGESQLDMKTLAKIHIARKHLQLTEDEYRDILERVTGHRSAREITPDQLSDLQREFRRLGWNGYLKPYHPKGRKKYEDLGDRGPDFPNPAQLRMLEARFKDIKDFATIDPDRAFRGFLRKRFGISDARFLDIEKYEAALTAVKRLEYDHGTRGPRYEDTR